MGKPYEECNGCLATYWCKRYTGEYPRPEMPEWCNPRFRMMKAIELSNIPEDYIDANIYNYVEDKENSTAINKVKPLLMNIREEVERNGKNFFIFGGKPGTGKTFLASTILNQYIYKTCLTELFDFENPLALFVEYPELMNRLRYNRDDEELERILGEVRDVPLLLLDDVGAGTVSDFVAEQTYLLLNYRNNRRLSTITTSNLTVTELSKLYGTRNTSRMLKRCEWVEVTGRDRRLDHLMGR